ncbi:MAG: ABC transporter permease [Bryobacteraceae bacterium]
MRFVWRRLYHGALLLVGISLLSFALFELAPGDYLEEMKVNPQIPRETIERLREQFGLDRPVGIRYVRWAASTLQGEFGQSMAYGMPVSDLIWRRAGNTVLLTATAILLTWLIAVPVGVWCASRPGGAIDRIAGAMSSTLVTLPDLLVGLVCVFLAIRWGVAPIHGNLWLATIALVFVSFPAVFRHTRSSVAQVMHMPFIGHLRACGIEERRILFRHALPAALNPIVSLFGLSLASLTSSSLVIEVIVSWPGLGPLLLESILARDVHVVLAAVLLSSMFLSIGNLVADLLLYAADPRIRLETG